jgi:S-formylglutathione hydrolase FrmB
VVRGDRAHEFGESAGLGAAEPLIERIVADSTKVFADAAAAAGVPVNYVVRPEGSHTWGLFESEMQGPGTPLSGRH